jgi:uncharacterized protein YacL
MKLPKRNEKHSSSKELENQTSDMKTLASVKKPAGSESVARPAAAEFAAMVAREIVKTLTFSNLRLKPFAKDLEIIQIKDIPAPEGENLILVDTSVLIDGRILPIVNSGFIAGTLLIAEFVLGEIQHIADSSDSLRRAKGRRGLEVVNALTNQKVNDLVVTKIIKDDVPEIKEVDRKLAGLAKQWKTKLLTVDYNLAQLARAQTVKVLNIHDLANAMKLSLIPGEELTIKITHEGKERDQGVGYLSDGTMVVVEDAKTKVGLDVVVVLSKVHQTAAGQLFFARLK